MDRIDLFRIFARVVETSSFTHAADTLNMPRSSVSTAIQELEARVGARLLARTTRSVAPTPDGAAFYHHCVRLVADVEETENLFRSDRAGPGGLLRVDMPGRIGRLLVAPALPTFLRHYPDIDIELGVTDRAINLIEDAWTACCASARCRIQADRTPDGGTAAGQCRKPGLSCPPRHTAPAIRTGRA